MNQIRTTVRKAINQLLSPTGLAVTRKETIAHSGEQMASQFIRFLGESESALRYFLFPDLPNCENRHRLMTELVGCAPMKAFFLLDALHKTLSLEGDVCEFGVAEGATSALLANEIRGTEKDLWLYDSFQGLPRPTEKDVLLNDIFKLGTMEKYEGWMASPKQQVLGRLVSIPFPRARTHIVEGFIEKTVTTKKMPSQVCFAYVDFDFYKPIQIALELLHTRLTSGGYIVVDDYGYFSSGAKTAVDEFYEKHKTEYVRSFPPAFTQHFVILHKLGHDQKKTG